MSVKTYRYMAVYCGCESQLDITFIKYENTVTEVLATLGAPETCMAEPRPQVPVGKVCWSHQPTAILNNSPLQSVWLIRLLQVDTSSVCLSLSVCVFVYGVVE